LPLVGIEPSAILSFRDEYPELVQGELKRKAKELASESLLFDEFLAREFREGRIDRYSFKDSQAEVLVHGHCQQKAIASSSTLLEILSIPKNYSVREIRSGCCGMAGSFGYEKEHYELSNKIGELVLFPEIRNAAAEVIISAPGTSCRHHISDGTGKVALHPAEVLYNALRIKQD
jgi:Fe-S oxidoreductase